MVDAEKVDNTLGMNSYFCIGWRRGDRYKRTCIKRVYETQVSIRKI